MVVSDAPGRTWNMLPAIPPSEQNHKRIGSVQTRIHV
jgi:hypothetical protein